MEACAEIEPVGQAAAPPARVESGQCNPALGRVLDLRVPVTVTLAERQMSLRSILEMTLGTIIEFDVPFDAELTLSVANRPIGRGRAVKVGEYFGLKISRIETVHGRIDAMAGQHHGKDTPR